MGVAVAVGVGVMDGMGVDVVVGNGVSVGIICSVATALGSMGANADGADDTGVAASSTPNDGILFAVGNGGGNVAEGASVAVSVMVFTTAASVAFAPQPTIKNKVISNAKAVVP